MVWSLILTLWGKLTQLKTLTSCKILIIVSTLASSCHHQQAIFGKERLSSNVLRSLPTNTVTFSSKDDKTDTTMRKQKRVHMKLIYQACSSEVFQIWISGNCRALQWQYKSEQKLPKSTLMLSWAHMKATPFSQFSGTASTYTSKSSASCKIQSSLKRKTSADRTVRTLNCVAFIVLWTYPRLICFTKRLYRYLKLTKMQNKRLWPSLAASTGCGVR